MRRKDESKKPIISDFINAFYYEHDKVPSVREIVEGDSFRLASRIMIDVLTEGQMRKI